MYFKRFNKTLLALVMALVLVVSSITPATATSNSLEDLANYALVKQYEKYYEKGENVGWGWGDIEPYDVYILGKAGVDVEGWTRNGTNLKQEVLASIEKLAAGNDTKHIAGGYLVASLLGDNSEAERLIGLVSGKINDNFGQNIYSDAPAIEYLGQAGSLKDIDVARAVYAITEAQYENGAFDEWQDIGVASQAIRSLYYLDKVIEDNGLKNEITESIESGLNWLKDSQQNDGSFSIWNYDPILDSYEVLVTIKVLGLGDVEWREKLNNGLAYILANSPNLDGIIGMNEVSNYTSILDLAMVLDDGYQAPDSFIYLESPKAEISQGALKQLKVNKFDKVGQKEEVISELTWKSNNPSIATVSNTGLLTGISRGTATITATHGDLVAQGTVKVLGSSGGGTVPSDKQGTAYVTIRGDSETGTILSSTAYIWTDKEVSVLHMLEKVLQGQGISYTATGGYVSEIAGLAHQKPSYPLSGWKFKVNGIDADKGAGDFTLKDGDRVEWYYSLDYTKDEDSKEFNIDKKKLEKEKEILTAAERWLEVHYVHILLKWWILFLG